MSRSIAIVQSNYIPWKGYFDLIARVDQFVLYDDAQFTKRDWRNRNRIKTPHGTQWLTVPVRTKGRYHQSVRETEVDGMDWAELHWKTLAMNYAKSPYFDEISGLIAPLYLECEYARLSTLNRTFIDTVSGYLGIRTNITWSHEYDLPDGKCERLAAICAQAGATEYVSGPAARDYLDPQVFSDLGVAVRWFDYTGYLEYPQAWGAFVHEVSVLDLLFHCGPDSSDFMKLGSVRT